MPPQDLATITTFTLAGITSALFVTAGALLLGTCFTIAPSQVRKLRTRVFKSLMASAVTGAAAIVISATF